MKFGKFFFFLFLWSFFPFFHFQSILGPSVFIFKCSPFLLPFVFPFFLSFHFGGGGGGGGGLSLSLPGHIIHIQGNDSHNLLFVYCVLVCDEVVHFKAL